MARWLRTVSTTVVSVTALAAGLGAARDVAPTLEARALQAGAYQADPLWPKPLPNHWILGSVTGVAVDGSDRVWIAHRGAASLTARTEMGLGTDPPTAEKCCAAAPQVLAFDRDGALVRQWGGPGPGYDWPLSPGGMAVDGAGNIWITAAGPPVVAGRGGGRAGGAGRGGAAAPPPPPADAHVLKFSGDGKFLLQIGKAGTVGATTSTTALNGPSAVAVDSAANEVYVADTGNRRIVVFDASTGAHKRHWGAYGEAPGAAPPAYDPAAPAPRQFRTVSCVEVSKDNLVYVCDRESNRIQVFQKNGTFVKEAVISKTTLGSGAVWDVAFSSDAGQQMLFVADGTNQQVHVLRRDTLAVAGSFGAGGRWPGTFYGVGSIAVDSRGTVYTGETLEGKRVQKFTAR